MIGNFCEENRYVKGNDERNAQDMSRIFRERENVLRPALA
jgi:hypothetical protein